MKDDAALYTTVQADGLPQLWSSSRCGNRDGRSDFYHRARNTQSQGRISILSDSNHGVVLRGGIAIWFVPVSPTNAEINEWTTTSVPANWTLWRNRWERAHAVRAVLFLVGFSTLILSALV